MNKAEEAFNNLTEGTTLGAVDLASGAHWFVKGYMAAIPPRKTLPGRTDFLDAEEEIRVKAEIKGWNDCIREMLK